MDWLSVARHLAGRSTEPLVVLDGSGRIRMITPALVQTLGFEPGEVEGRSFIDALVPKEAAGFTARWLHSALRAPRHECECEIVGKDGRRFLLGLETSPIPGEEGRALLMSVLSVTPISPGRTSGMGDHVEYEICAGGPDFGKLYRLSFIGGSVEEHADARRRCFSVLRSRSEPCTDCPVLQPPGTPWPRIVVRRGKERSDTFEIVTAQGPTGPTGSSVSVCVRVISQTTLDAIHAAKLRALGDRAKLSQRERDVMAYLLMGRSIEDIAKILEISARTVKFHQANVLEKLGADSRADLVRLVL